MNFLNFFYLLFSFLFTLSLEQNFGVLDFFQRTVGGNDDNREENECICDINRYYCNYLCCCDKKCDNYYKDEWNKRNKCINKKDTISIFADRCIDKNLLYNFTNSRGLHQENETEDISINNKTIDNYCFSIDNFDKERKEAKKLNNYTQEQIFNATIKIAPKKKNSNLKMKNKFRRTSDKSINNDNEFYYDQNSKISIINYTAFNINDKFALYRGDNCAQMQEVKILNNINYTCSMNKSGNLIKNITNAINEDSHEKKIYTVDSNRLLSVNNERNKNITNDEVILEIEFILKSNISNIKEISDYSINIVKINKNYTINDTFTFKNSVIFSNNATKIPYRKSGTISYIPGSPLKVSRDDKIYNEFYIIGKYGNGSCRTDDNLDDYLYFDDKPILYNQDYYYSCKYNNSENNLENFSLIKKLNKDLKVGKYGNSYYNIKDWIKVENKTLNLTDINKTLIKMDIYLCGKTVGIVKYKYICNVTLKNENNTENNTLSLKINYYDEEEKIYEKIPDFPAFVPSMPDDLLDPLIYSNVDK